jgi:hypothetical protein
MNSPATLDSGNRSDDSAPRRTSPLRLIFRIVRWTTSWLPIVKANQHIAIENYELIPRPRRISSVCSPNLGGGKR